MTETRYELRGPCPFIASDGTACFGDSGYPVCDAFMKHYDACCGNCAHDYEEHVR